MNIPEACLKIKSWYLRDAALPILIILVGLGSFGLGRLSVLEAKKEPPAGNLSAVSSVGTE